MLRIAFFLALFIGACAYALARGGAPERVAVGIFAGGLLLTALTATASYVARFSGLEIGILIVDSIMLAAFVILSLHAERYWPIWMSGMQAVEVLSHLPMLIAPDVLPQAYTTITALWSYPMLVLLIVATYRHRRRIARYGKDASWSVFSSAPGSPNRG